MSAAHEGCGLTFGSKQALFQQSLDRYLAGPAAFMHAALQEPTAYRVAERILHDSAVFLTRRSQRSGCMTIQGALVGGADAEPVRRKLIALRVKEQNALRRRFERAQSEGDLPRDAGAADLARFITAVFQGMTVQAINGASRAALLRLAEISLRVFPQPLRTNPRQP